MMTLELSLRVWGLIGFSGIVVPGLLVGAMELVEKMKLLHKEHKK